MRGHRFNEALLDADILDFDAIDALGRLVIDYYSEANQNLIRRRRRPTFADRATQAFHRQFQAVWGAPENPDVEIKVDKKSKEAVDDFLDSFKIHNSLEFGS